MAADTSSRVNSSNDLYEYLLGLSDGTITRRATHFPDKISPTTTDPNQPGLVVLSRDVTINGAKNTWARIFLPREALDSSSKIPIIVYYHGGGFVLGSAAGSMFHDFCSEIASQFPAAVVSVEYRLAPEHRLPAAYDDAVEALHWIKTKQDGLLNEYADLNRCWIMGSSAGGNIAYHAGLRAAAQVDDLMPLKIRGLILQQAYFGGSQRTESELLLVNDPLLPPVLNDLMWDMSLPIGANRDHEYCNPTVGDDGKKLWDKVGLLGWKVLVIGCNGDPLIDRQISLVEMLKGKGVQVEHQFDEGGFHGSTMIEPSKTKVLHVLKNFCLSL
ncbi:carboxylesterase 1-like [Tripterygium wilfordii]|uniref:carboxylesterase 1-like n=1 Tax=Tripterygium wilfordii TaxID=458696 RepID=UPI0018F80D26|nr:carboxylesterase 1-like [Tripterygium wilfordii]